MRIGIDAHAVERDGSGNCTYMRGLLRGLADVDTTNQYVLYATNLAHPYYESLRRSGRFELRRLRRQPAPLRLAIALAMQSANDRLDLLHVQYGGPPWLRGRLVSTIHDVGFLEVPGSFSRLERLWMPRLIRFTARRATLVLTGSEFSRRQVSEWARIPRERVRLTPYGIGAEFAPVSAGPARNAVLQRYGINPPFLLSLGRLNPRKNVSRVVDAFERVALPGLQLVIAGVEDYRSEALEARLRRSTDARSVRCVGFVRHEDLPAVLSAASAFVYPSLFEGFGLPPLEAAACGTPVVASNTAALPEVLGDAALLVDPTDVGALADGLRRVLSDSSLRDELRHRGLQRAARYSWTDAARLTVAAYDEAARR